LFLGIGSKPAHLIRLKRAGSICATRSSSRYRSSTRFRPSVATATDINRGQVRARSTMHGSDWAPAAGLWRGVLRCFRRLRIRSEQRADTHEALLEGAWSFITHRQLGSLRQPLPTGAAFTFLLWRQVAQLPAEPQRRNWTPPSPSRTATAYWA